MESCGKFDSLAKPGFKCLPIPCICTLRSKKKKLRDIFRYAVGEGMRNAGPLRSPIDSRKLYYVVVTPLPSYEATLIKKIRCPSFARFGFWGFELWPLS